MVFVERFLVTQSLLSGLFKRKFSSTVSLSEMVDHKIKRTKFQIIFLKFGDMVLFCMYGVFPENEYPMSYPIRPEESFHLSYECFKMFYCCMS